jgi:hypothetical protein
MPFNCDGISLTGYTGEELPSKVLDLAVGERHKGVALQKIKDTLSQKIHNYTDMVAVVKAVSEVDTAVPVLLVICLQSR